MPAISVDFSKTIADAMPAGEYPVEIQEVVLKDNREKTGQYLNFKLSVIDGTHVGRTLWFICSLQEQALFNLLRTLKALGIPVVKGEPFALEVDDNNYLVNPPLVGMKGTVKVKQRDGEDRNVVDKFVGTGNVITGEDGVGFQL